MMRIVAVMLSAFITLMGQGLEPLLQTKDIKYTHPQNVGWVR